MISYSEEFLVLCGVSETHRRAEEDTNSHGVISCRTGTVTVYYSYTCDILMDWRVAGTGEDPKFIYNFNKEMSLRAFAISRKRCGENREGVT